MRAAKTIWSLFLFFVSGLLYAQNLETIGQGKAFSISGGLNINQVFYQADGVENRRDPYNYFIAGNLNLAIYGWSVPFSFSYSDQNTSFQQPFNQYGMSPTYKNVTAHIGFRSMNFSRYSLAGHLFLGTGAEVAVNEKLKVAAMYGRLNKAVESDTSQSLNTPAYKRMGGGAKVTYGSAENFVDLTFFKAKDDVESISNPPTEEIKPEENLVLGLGFGVSPLKGLSLKGEIAGSALTTDTRAEQVSTGNIYDHLNFLIPQRVSSSFYKAMNGTVSYQFSQYVFGVNYERVDPGYRTLGAYYFNNDLENIALIHRSSWLQQKLNLNLRVGVQKNNLDNSELSSMRRVSMSGSVNYQITPRFTTQFNYSDFNTYVNFRPLVEVIDQSTPYDNLDTLNYHQLARQASSNFNLVLSERKESRQNLNVNFSYQETTEGRAAEDTYSGTRFYNLNTAYILSMGETGWSFNLAGNVNLTQAQINNLIVGPSASVRKSMLDNKLSTHLTFSYNQARVEGAIATRIYNLRAGGNYTFKEVHQFTLNMTAIDRNSPGKETGSHFREFVAEVGYNYRFGGG
ncbi:MAG: hypothetical protein RLQ12_07770 [Cyclobacteriaceae bacterium]